MRRVSASPELSGADLRAGSQRAAENWVTSVVAALYVVTFVVFAAETWPQYCDYQ